MTCPAVEMWRSGATIRQVATAFSTTFRQVRAALRRGGVTQREIEGRQDQVRRKRGRDHDEQVRNEWWQSVSKTCPLTLEELRAPKRDRATVEVRHRVWRELHALNCKVIAIARFFERDHTSVLHALRKPDGA